MSTFMRIGRGIPPYGGRIGSCEVVLCNHAVGMTTVGPPGPNWSTHDLSHVPTKRLSRLHPISHALVCNSRGRSIGDHAPGCQTSPMES